MEEKPQKPRRFQFTLRTVLIVVTAAATLLSWWSYKAEKQRRAVEVLQKHGAWVVYGHVYGDGGTNPYSAPEPRFAHWRYRVSNVSLFNSPTESDIAALKSLDGLQTVFIYNWFRDMPQVRDALPNCHVEPFHSSY